MIMQAMGFILFYFFGYYFCSFCAEVGTADKVGLIKNNMITKIVLLFCFKKNKSKVVPLFSLIQLSVLNICAMLSFFTTIMYPNCSSTALRFFSGAVMFSLCIGVIGLIICRIINIKSN